MQDFLIDQNHLAIWAECGLLQIYQDLSIRGSGSIRRGIWLVVVPVV